VDPTRKAALAVGVFFLITFIASIPTQFILYEPVLKHSGYVLGAGADTRIALGAFFEVVLVIAGIGSAVAAFSVLKRVHEGFALGYVAARIIESALILVGILSLLTITTLRQVGAGSGAGDATLVLFGKSLVGLHDWTFLLGPGLLGVLGNGLILGYLMYRSELVPRRMALVGLVGGTLVVLSGIAVLFGVYSQVSAISAIATLPEFVWELFLGIYLTLKGFRPEAVARLYPAPVLPPGEPEVAPA
jgi:hypothetical protein